MQSAIYEAEIEPFFRIFGPVIRALEIKAGQIRASMERSSPEGGDVVRDRDAGQRRARLERTIPNGGDADADRDAGQRGAGGERVIPMVLTRFGIVMLVSDKQ